MNRNSNFQKPGVFQKTQGFSKSGFFKTRGFSKNPGFFEQGFSKNPGFFKIRVFWIPTLLFKKVQAQKKDNSPTMLQPWAARRRWIRRFCRSRRQHEHRVHFLHGASALIASSTPLQICHHHSDCNCTHLPLSRCVAAHPHHFAPAAAT